LDATLRVARIALYPDYFVVARGQKRVRSLLLSTSARNPD
jgi:hypothetical protein